eukprot:Em0005g1393a
MELDENVQPASSQRSYTLSKDVLPPLETLVVTIVGSTELDGILSVAIPNRLLEDWANSRSTDTSFVALLNERIEDDIMSFDPDATRLETQLYRRSLSVASKLRKTRGAKRIDVLFGSTITTIYKGNHTIAVVKADSFVNVNGNPYPIELFLSSDMKDFEELYTMISSESPPLNAADDIHQHGSMKQFSCQGVEKHNDDAKRNYFSSNQWDAPAEDRVQAGRAA